MTNRKRFYFFSIIAISILFLRSFPKINISTWSFLLMTQEEMDFLKAWCRLQRSQLDVNDHLGSCQSCLHHNTPCERTSGETTEVKHSYVSGKDIRQAGDFSRFFITTRNTSGHLKLKGGDSWKVHLEGPSFLSASVFDLRNGTYEVVFIPVLPGRYHVDIILVNSMCKGILGPREFYSDLGHLGYYVNIPKARDDPVLNRLQYHMKFRSRFGSSIFHYQRCCEHCGSCDFLWNGYGTWETERGKLKWRPYIKVDDRPRKVNYRKRAIRKNGTLWFYGDQLSQIYYSVMNRPLCEKIFRNCENPKHLYPKQDFRKLSVTNITRLVISNIRSLLKYSLQLPENALILNSVFIGHLPYKSYIVVIDKIAQLLHDAFNDTVHGQIVWSTMMSSPGSRQNLHYPIYNAYATWKMCNAKIPILDLFPLSDSYPHSSKKNKLKLYLPFESVERLLEDFFERTADR